MKTTSNNAPKAAANTPSPTLKEKMAGTSNTPDAALGGAISNEQKPFVKKNYLFMGIALLMIVTGFLLMTGSSNAIDAKVFNQDIFSTRRIVVGPTIAFLGFVAMAFAILYSPKRKDA